MRRFLPVVAQESRSFKNDPTACKLESLPDGSSSRVRGREERGKAIALSADKSAPATVAGLIGPMQKTGHLRNARHRAQAITIIAEFCKEAGVQPPHGPHFRPPRW